MPIFLESHLLFNNQTLNGNVRRCSLYDHDLSFIKVQISTDILPSIQVLQDFITFTLHRVVGFISEEKVKWPRSPFDFTFPFDNVHYELHCFLWIACKRSRDFAELFAADGPYLIVIGYLVYVRFLVCKDRYPFS